MLENSMNGNKMAQAISDYINGRRDDKDVKLLKEVINKRLIQNIESLGKSDSSIKERLVVIKKEKKPKDMTALSFEQRRYKSLVELAGNEAQQITDEYHETLTTINSDHNIATWLDWAAGKASDVSLATHVAKLTNSSISASNIIDSINCNNSRYLTTSHLEKIAVDGAYGNAALAPVATLLQLGDGENNLAEYVLQTDTRPFVPFSSDNGQVHRWTDGLMEALDSSRKTSHYLSKQIYFPVSDANYHLLLPLTSSSLAHCLFEKFQIYFSKEQKQVRDLKKAGNYSDEVAVRYPQKAILRVTASQHQNVSALNGKRSGRLGLLPSLAPKWKSVLKPPEKGKSVFQGPVNYCTRDKTVSLQRFLLLVKNRKLNVKNPSLHKTLLDHLDDIIDELFNYVANIQSLTKLAGWSGKSELKLAHKLWLDPDRADDDFQQQRRGNNWQEEIVTDFSAWLRHRLENKKLTFSIAQEKFWQKIFKQRLREFEAVREAR